MWSKTRGHDLVSEKLLYNVFTHIMGNNGRSDFRLFVGTNLFGTASVIHSWECFVIFFFENNGFWNWSFRKHNNSSSRGSRPFIRLETRQKCAFFTMHKTRFLKLCTLDK